MRREQKASQEAGQPQDNSPKTSEATGGQKPPAADPDADTGKPNGRKNVDPSDIWRRPEWWIVFVTGIYVVVSGLQWNAARDMLSFAQTTFEKGNRAYVGIGYVALPSGISVEQPFRGEVKLVNAGNTPAKKLTVRNYWMISTVPILPEWPVYPPQNEFFLSSAVLVPGQEGIKSNPDLRGLPSQELKEVQAGRKWLILYGTVSYEDVFGTARNSKYCAFYPPSHSFSENRALTFCPTHNSMD